VQTKGSDFSGIVLAFDYGLRQIGVAVGETLTKSARPLAIIKARDGIPDWPDIEKLIEEYRPAYIVIGLPLNMDGSESEMSGRARKFGNRLHGRFGLQVCLQDERLSSNEVKQGLRENASYASRNKTRRKPLTALDRIDDQAASLILQSHFNER